MPTSLRIIRIVQLVFGGILFLPLPVVLATATYGVVAGKNWFNSDPFVSGQEFLRWLLFLLIVAWGALNILSGIWIGKGKNRTGSLVLACMNIILFPVGTLIGLPSVLVLLSRTGKEYYVNRE